MPRVKIDYVVSFSSEDPDNPASNLLGWDVSKKRWLCCKGAPSCSVVLQLTRAVKVNAVHVGAHHAALVEVLVGRSETPNEPFQVLVPSCVFLTPAESRRSDHLERVRSFAADQLAPARDQRWDRLRVVCSQPYNKHCKYGLSFVHVHSADGGGDAGSAGSGRPAPVAAPDSSDDEFAPGELFAQHRGRDTAEADTGALIRQASSQALKNISDSATKLVKTPISKHSSKQGSRPDRASTSNRRRDGLMYTDDDDRPHAKIDHIVQRHKDEKTKEEKKLAVTYDRKDGQNESLSKDVNKDDSQKDKSSDRHKDRRDRSSDQRKERPPPVKESRMSQPHATSSRSNDDGKRERPRDDSDQKAPARGSVLRGVVLALSGYVHPRRARLRDAALALGARAVPDWTDDCTHLICAFPNTPKLKQVRAAHGDSVPAVTGEWVDACLARGRRLPWRWYATEPRLRERPGDDEPDDQPTPAAADEDADTDDEIEKAICKQKKRRIHRSRSPSAEPGAASAAAVSDVIGDARDDGARTDEEPLPGEEEIDESATLPELFAGSSFVIDGSVRAACDAGLLARYVRAYGGLLLEEEQVEADTRVDYIVSLQPRPGTRCVSPAWLWQRHQAGA